MSVIDFGTHSMTDRAMKVMRFVKETYGVDIADAVRDADARERLHILTIIAGLCDVFAPEDEQKEIMGYWWREKQAEIAKDRHLRG